uniref:Astacin domain-containing protein n=1 Tax=Strongyloides papillosus TaxID=174720 RepID=A0A0N5BB83_STREA
MLLFLTQDTVKGGSEVSDLKSITPPPYYQESENTYYYYDPEVSDSRLDLIFRQLNRFTCLKFARQKSKVVGKIGINFEISPNENKVELSRSLKTPTTVFLKKDDYKNGTLLRLFIGFALDIVPEVGRPDRENEVTVNLENIDDKYQKYYKLESVDNTTYLKDTEFDFKSPMFFSSEFGSKEKKPTYTVKLYKEYEYFSNGGKVFRHNDYKHIYYYYCTNSRNVTHDCMYGGYPLPDEPTKCSCPEYLDGNKCEKLKQNEDDCMSEQQNITAKENEVERELKIKKGVCYFNISSENNENVSITIKKLVLKNSDCETYKSNVEVLVRKDKGAAGINLCKDNNSSISLPILYKEVFLVFKNREENTELKFSYKTVNGKKPDTS